MEIMPFVGEEPQARLPRTNTAGLMFAGMGFSLASLLLLMISIGAVMLGSIVTPFYYYDTMLIIAVALGPAALVFVCTARNGLLLAKLASAGPLKAINLICGLVVFLIIAPGNVVLYANQRFDSSLAGEETVPVKEAWIRTGRHGSQSYVVDVVTKVRKPYRRFSFYGQEPVSLERSKWERVVPGQTSLVLREHGGRLGFAWYEPGPALKR